MRKFILLFIFLTGISGYCDASGIRPRKLEKMIKTSTVLSKHFTGFSLYDLDKRKPIAGYNEDKYFTPASNTKLFTFYAGLKLLGDSIAGIQYVEKGDSLIVWGTGDPTFLNADYPIQQVAGFLKNSGKKVFLSYGRYQNPFFGVGWTYDDYNEYYQPEITELPVYGNVVIFSSGGNNLVTFPQFDRNSPFQLVAKGQASRFKVTRDFQSNVFNRPEGQVPANFNQLVPFKVDQETLSRLLKDNISNFSGLINYRKPLAYKTIFSIPADTLYKNMLLPSDNFFAEQILLNMLPSTVWR